MLEFLMHWRYTSLLGAGALLLGLYVCYLIAEWKLFKDHGLAEAQNNSVQTRVLPTRVIDDPRFQ